MVNLPLSDEGRVVHRQNLRGFAGVPVVASDVLVYNKTGKLIRIEDKDGRIIAWLRPKQATCTQSIDK